MAAQVAKQQIAEMCVGSSRSPPSPLDTHRIDLNRSLFLLSGRGGVDTIDELRDELEDVNADFVEIQEALTGNVEYELVRSCTDNRLCFFTRHPVQFPWLQWTWFFPHFRCGTLRWPAAPL